MLVAEGHADTRSMMRTMLTLEGFDVIESSNGAGTLEAVASLHPDVIVLDSEVDGLMVAKNLHSQDPAAEPGIVFVSAHVGRALEQSVQAAGCDSFLLKPLDFDQLLRIVRRLACRASGAR
ncbi:MAG: response regulator [Acidobacteria bacterium]|nr:response regulator [Acidobacteriota bacterium]